MTEIAVAHTEIEDSSKAGSDLGVQVSRALQGQPPDALILFASTRYEHSTLLRAVNDACRPKLLVGGSSAGEFTDEVHGEGRACAIAIRAPDIRFAAGIGRGLRTDRTGAAADVVKSFRGATDREHAFRTALVLVDSLAGNTEDFLEALTRSTGGTYQFFGGGVGGDAQFAGTCVFFGTEVVPDAVVALEILSNKPIGIGMSHGWQPAGPPLRVTESEGMRLGSMNAVSSADVFGQHAEATKQEFRRDEPLPFFLHNVLGVQQPTGYKLRVPLAVNEDDSVTCATEVPALSTVRIMCTSRSSAVEAATIATRNAIEKLEGATPKLALFFDCVATRLRLGQEFGFEVDAVKNALGPGAALAGINTIGQIAREGQAGGFHNCTAVVCVFPE